MRIAGFRIERFGAIVDWYEEGLEEHDLIVLLGPNESGKSTLREFITTALFGFSPASRDAHPYAPADQEASFGGTLQLLVAGERISVARSLRGTPRGRLHRATRHEDLDNRPLTEVAAIGRAIYRDVHTISAEEIAAISPGAWHTVEDRLLSGSAMTFLRSAGDVRRALEEEAARAWRPDRRGTPEARAIEGEIADRRGAERQASERMHRLVAIDHELHEVASSERVVRLRSAERDARRHRHERLAPALLADDRIRRQRGEASELLPVDDLPADPAGALRHLDADIVRLAAAGERGRERVAELTATIGLAGGAQALLDRAAEVQEAALLSATRDSAVTAIAAARANAEQREREAERRGAAVLGRPPTASDETAVERVDLSLLRAAIGSVERASAARPARTPILAAGIGAVVLAVLAVLGTVGRAGPLVGAVTLAAVAVVALRGHDRPAARAAQASIEVALGDLDLPADRRATSEGTLVTDLTLLVQALADRRAAMIDARRLEARLAADDARLGWLLSELGFEDAAHATVAVDEARDRIARASAAARTLAHVRRELAEEEASLAQSTEERDALLHRLARVGDGPEDAGRRVARARALRAAADAAEQEESRSPELVAEARSLVADGACLVLDDAALARLDAEHADDHGLLERLHRQRGALESERRALEAGPSAADLAGEIGALTERLGDVQRRRDRLALLATILAAAERRYREAHDPRFLAVASEHLAAITGGRYTRVAVTDETPSGTTPRLGLVRQDGDLVLVAPPLSRGTLEQVYVALRLALVDEVDPSKAGPLFLDETLVHWDDARVDAFLPLLAKTGGRQVLVATCHGQLADRLVAHGARLVRLPHSDADRGRTGLTTSTSST